MPRAVRLRTVSVLSSLVVLAGLLSTSAGGALAQDTRAIFLGSGPAQLASCSSTTGFCPLEFSTVATTGSAHTATDVVLANLGGQTLNHLVVHGGTAADAAPKNPSFPYPTSPSVPAPLSIFNVYPDAGMTCEPVTGNSFSCSVTTLAAGQSVSLRVVINVPAGAPSTSSVWLVALVNESSSSGSNRDSFFATGTVGVGAASCAQNANYFVPTETVALSTVGTCQQPTSIKGPNTPRGTFASVGTTVSDQCPNGYSCVGLLSLASVNNGQSGPVTWTVTWAFKTKGVIHFRANYDPANPTTYDVILFKQQHKCPNPTPATANCWFSVTNAGGSTTAVFQTDTNLGTRGV